MGKAPEFGKVASVANGLWGKQGRVTVSTMGSLFVFQFLNEEVMTWVLESGPWHVERKYLVLQKWSPQFTEEVLNMRKMPIWVQLRKIPLQYFHPKGISYLVSAIGKPLYMDRATALRSRLDYAKVCIEVEVEKEIPEFLTVDLGDNYTVNVLVDVPWLPEKCDRCKAFGHRCNNAAERPLEAGLMTPNALESTESAETSSPQDSLLSPNLMRGAVLQWNPLHTLHTWLPRSPLSL
ncbi:hypothetical protein CRG98_046883 [Punica granatum]|uniref:DUF4283 domain-containing protein n=1 Tax=Punica granatum TaxID=22663 RepID=A0A2I0HLV3_PUNGR|nr:hypothetical protein CRG98_046883 [Punica granatum]